jgi:hypothetical protein
MIEDVGGPTETEMETTGTTIDAAAAAAATMKTTADNAADVTAMEAAAAAAAAAGTRGAAAMLQQRTIRGDRGEGAGAKMAQGTGIARGHDEIGKRRRA